MEAEKEVVCDLSNSTLFNDLVFTLTAETASGFYHWLKPNYLRKYATELREIFGIGSLTGVYDCYEIGLRSLYRVGQISKLLILSKYGSKTEKIGGM